MKIAEKKVDGTTDSIDQTKDFYGKYLFENKIQSNSINHKDVNKYNSSISLQ